MKLFTPLFLACLICGFHAFPQEMEMLSAKTMRDLVTIRIGELQKMPLLTLEKLRDEQHNTLLHTAADVGATNAITFLLKKGFNVNALGEDDQTALTSAIFRNQTNAINMLLSSGADPLLRDSAGMSPAQYVVFEKRCSTLKMLLKKYPQIMDSTNKVGEGLLHTAVRRSSLCCLESLLKAGAKPDTVDDFGTTPLYLAVGREEMPAIQLLIRYGANPRYLNGLNSESPLDLAKRRSMQSCVDLFNRAEPQIR